MTCNDVRERLDDYLAGALDNKMRLAFESHATACPECSADLGAANVLAPLTAALPRSIQPPADLWSGIAGRLAPRRSPRWRMAVLAAAAAILLVVASSAATLWFVHSRGEPLAIADTSTPAIEAGYVDASAALLRALESEPSHLTPATVATLERNLAVIDAAIAESRAALAGDPDNRALAAILWASYRQKVALLEQVTRLADQT